MSACKNFLAVELLLESIEKTFKCNFAGGKGASTLKVMSRNLRNGVPSTLLMQVTF